MAFPKKKYWIEAGDIKTKLPKQHDTGMFRSLDEIVWDILKCCGWDCCTQSPGEENALTFENGLTNTAGIVKLGGLLTDPTTTIEGVKKTFTVYLHNESDSTQVTHNATNIVATVADASESTVINHKPNKVVITHTGSGAAKLGVGTASPTSNLHVVGLPEYADNAAALVGLLTAGAFYHTAGVLKVVI